VKFLIDNNLSPLLAEGLKAAGHDAVHLRDLGMQAAPDPAVLQIRRLAGRRAAEQSAIILANLDPDTPPPNAWLIRFAA
jgi:predicted nuclease of predicted toxin-antitoxin system